MPQAKRRIIVIGPRPPPFTGQSLSFDMLIEGLREHDCHPLVVDISRKSDKYSRLALPFRLWDLLTAYISLLKYLFALQQRTVYITIAQSRNGFFRDFIFIWSSIFFGSKIVVHLKGGNYDGFYKSQGFMIRFLIKLTLKRTAKIIVLGKSLTRMFDFDPHLRRRIKVIHNGLPDNNRGRSKLLAVNQPVKILFLSNLIDSKGYLDVLRSIAILRDKYHIDAEGLFAGEFMRGDDDEESSSPIQKRDNFYKLVNTLRLNERVTYFGTITGDKKWEFLQDAHFFCLPTNYINEGQPVAVIEAMAFGCVVLSTEFRAITDLIQNNVNGRFVRFSEPETIATAINDIISGEEYNAMSKESIRIFEEKFTREIHLNNIVLEIMH